MKKALTLFIASLIIVLSFSTLTYAVDTKYITSVAVTQIDAPFSNGNVLDTSGKVANGSPYRIIDISWQTPATSISGFYEVTITLKANKYYAFSLDTVGSVNGDSIKGKELIKDDEFKIVYAFDEKSSTSSNIGSSSSTTRYRITVAYDEKEGTITPSLIRVLKGRDQTVKIIPNEGYQIKDVKVDDEYIGPVSEYTFKNVNENHSIRAYFEKIKEMKPIYKLLFDLLESLKR